MRFEGRVPLVRKRSAGRFAVLWTCGFWTSLYTEKGCAGGGLASYVFDVTQKTSQLRILAVIHLCDVLFWSTRESEVSQWTVFRVRLIDRTKINLRV